MADSGVATFGSSSADDLGCVKCLQLLNKPMMLPCGHRICKDCLGKVIISKDSFQCENSEGSCLDSKASRDNVQCPSTEEHCPLCEVSEIREDRWAEREITKIKKRHSTDKEAKKMSTPISRQQEGALCPKAGTKRRSVEENFEIQTTSPDLHVADIECEFKRLRQATSEIKELIVAQGEMIKELEETLSNNDRRIKTLKRNIAARAVHESFLQQRNGSNGLRLRLASAENSMNIIPSTAGDNVILKKASVVDDGKFILRIPNYAMRRAEARCGAVLSLTSPAFLTSPYGYQMCLRVYLNGDGDAAGEFLSVYLVLMKGTYDNIQEWPFHKHVTISLKAQKVNGGISEDFGRQVIVDPSLPGCQRPTGQMGPAFGIKKFIKITDMQIPTFLADDTVFIKVTVS